MVAKEGSLCTDDNSFLDLHSHYVCNGGPSDKVVSFLMVWRRLTLIKKIAHFSVSMFNSERKYGILSPEE